MWLGFSIDDGGLTVSTNTQVDLLLEGVGLEGLGNTENGILHACATISIGPCRSAFPMLSLQFLGTP